MPSPICPMALLFTGALRQLLAGLRRRRITVMREKQPLHRSRHCDVQKPGLARDVVLHVRHGFEEWNEHHRELEAFAAVEGDELDAVLCWIELALVGTFAEQANG